MSKQNISKQEAKKEIEEFFKDKENKKPKEIKKIKKLAMSFNIPLKEKRKLFCKKCFSVFNSKNSKIKIKNKIKSVTCQSCGYVSRWRINKP